MRTICRYTACLRNQRRASVSDASYTKKRMSFFSRNKYKYDYYICGSDQIWSPALIPLRKYYYLSFVGSSKKMAYAASFGINSIPKFHLKAIRNYISDFSYLSLRENSSLSIVNSLVKKEAYCVLDPTLVVKKTFWENYLSKQQKFIRNDKYNNENYYFCYFLNMPNKSTITYIRKQARNKRILIAPYNYHINDFTYCDSNPVDFLFLVSHATCIFTDSFHGVCFSVIFEKEFLVFEREHNNNLKQTSRITSLLGILNLSSRFLINTSAE